MFRGTASAVVKLSNLLLLLNQSRGKHRIDEKFRWKELVVFKVNPVFAVAASYQNTYAHEVASAAASASASASACDSTTAGNTYHNTHDDGEVGYIETSVRAMDVNMESLTPSRGSIPISPAKRSFRPTTVPYYDVNSQSIVQIRRKKSMSELRDKLSSPTN